MITGLEKPVSWMKYAVTEDRNRGGNSEPEAMALMNSREYLHTVSADGTPEFSGWIRSSRSQGQS